MADPELDDLQMTRILDQLEPQLRTAFLRMLEAVRTRLTPDSILRMIREGRYDEANAAFDAGAEAFANEVTKASGLAAEQAALFLSGALRTLVTYDQFNERAVDFARKNRYELIQAFSNEQRDLVRSLVMEAFARGTNPRDVGRQLVNLSRDIHQGIGLTPKQAAAVSSYRDALERAHNARSQETDALTRELRDGRSDRSVQRAIRTGEPLSKEQIDRMVDRYRENYVRFRAETIARTEALRAAHEGVEEAVQQVLDSGNIDEQYVTRTWNTAGDERVRDSHIAMDGQERGVGETFTSGLGNELAYPGDPEAPPEDTINCRCVISTRISIEAVAAAAAEAFGGVVVPSSTE